MKHSTGILASLIIFFLWRLPADADGVHLRNGDPLTGEIMRMGKRSLFVNTAYAGEVKLKWGGSGVSYLRQGDRFYDEKWRGFHRPGL